MYKVFAQEVEATHALLLPYLPLNRPPFNPEAIPARQRFLHRRIKLAQNIVRWRKYTQERFGIGGLVSRLLMQDFMPVAESGWEVGGEECARKVSLIHCVWYICSPWETDGSTNTARAYSAVAQVSITIKLS